MEERRPLTQARRMEVLEEEQTFAAETEDYRLRLKRVKDFFNQQEGWVGSIYFKHEGPGDRAGFTANTHIHNTRDQALEVGKELMNKIQEELDASLAQQMPKQQATN